MSDENRLDRAQQGLGDMDVEDFRRAAHEVVDRAADYLARLETYPVLPDIEPGDVRAQLPPSPPAAPEPLARILADYGSLIEPNITHWQHPGYMAYFSSTATGPGILGEWLAATLNSNVMFWRNAPASTELEELVVAWLRQMLGLPEAFDGMFTDTASISSLLSIVAARHQVPGLEARERGLGGRSELGRLRLYMSTEAHSSIEKAAIVAGIGREGVRRIGVDDAYRLRPELLARAIAEDRAGGWLPFCVVATVGTTSSTSVDPVGQIAPICRDEKLWLHVDAAYAGTAALAPELRSRLGGWEQGDSIVVNPHKLMFTPFDASLLLFREPEVYRDALSLVPEYLRTRDTGSVHNFHEYGIQLGRRFRALKLWFMIRYFGVEGMAQRVREFCRQAGELARWIEQDEDWELLAPHPFSTVCFRYRPADYEGSYDLLNEQLLAEVNRSGRIFLSHTRLGDRYTIRATFGNPRAEQRHVETCWEVLRAAAAAVR
jgi:aromatic-L-amino-acid decarboxylase